MGGEGKRLYNDVAAEGRKRLPPLNNQDDLFFELWHACAGPAIHVPRVGQKVFYFPQGHMEQVASYTNEDGEMEMPIYNLPSKILCKVVFVQLKAEATTDEVFAQITLLPVAEQDEQSSEDGNPLSLAWSTSACSFSKKLTPSDTNTHGGFSILKRHADECLPQLECQDNLFLSGKCPNLPDKLTIQDLSLQPPVQELVAKDLHGTEWHFRHIYRGQPKRHLLTSGWSTFVTSKKLVAGDAFIFLRGKNGELRVGIRRATHLQNNASTSVISGCSMQHGILASAFHAFSTGTKFSVYYRPWTSPAEFIIPFDNYMKSAKIDYSIGKRFKMQFEGEECAEHRYGGTVVGIEDVDPIRWPESGWRCLRVKWDATFNAVVRPERVSPWDIEPIDIISNSDQPPQKRPRPSDLSTHMLPSFVKEGLMQNSVKFASRSGSGVLQGQESAVSGINIVDVPKPPLILNMDSPSNPDGNHKNVELENQLQFSVQDSLYCFQGSKVPFTGGNTADVDLSFHWLPAFISYGLVNTVVSRNPPVPNSSSHDQRALELKDGNEVRISQLNGGSRCMVFGVNLHSPPELPSPQVATSNERGSLCSVLPMSQSSVSQGIQLSEQSKSVSSTGSRKQCNNCCFAANWSHIKAQKCGTALGRSVDLSLFDGYDELICELDHLFDFKGSLIEGSSMWHVTYIDNEGDMMLLGDYPWQKFQFTARKLIICLKEDNDEPNLNLPDPVPME